MSDRSLLYDIFSTYNITAVMHFAAYIAVGESVTDPGEGYGDICHQCIAKGGNWIQFQLQKFSQKLLA